MKHRTDPRVLLLVSEGSGAGKTVLLEALLPRLRAAGLRVAAMKRTHHDVELDPEGTDSRRLRDAGAAPVLLRGPRTTAIFAPTPVGDELATLVAVAAAFGPLDLVLVEGGREVPAHARVELVAPGGKVRARPPALIAVVANSEVETFGVPRYRRDEVEGLAAFVLAWCR